MWPFKKRKYVLARLKRTSEPEGYIKKRVYVFAGREFVMTREGKFMPLSDCEIVRI